MFLIRLERWERSQDYSVRITYITVATFGSLGPALAQIKKYQDSLCEHYLRPARVAFRLDAVTAIEGVSKADLEGVGVKFVYDLGEHDEE